VSAALAQHARGVAFRVGLDEIGIACRYKAGPAVRPADEGGHADALLPGGEPIGHCARTRRDRRLAIVAPGMVRDAAALLRDRPEHLRAEAARARNCPTTFCVVRVGEARARDFAAARAEIGAHPPLFVAIGGNCAQVIGGALPPRCAKRGSPDALFRAFARVHPGARIASGHADWTQEGWEIAP
jgi:hypothetical protein